jgi:hypothetical protein
MFVYSDTGHTTLVLIYIVHCWTSWIFIGIEIIV